MVVQTITFRVSVVGDSTQLVFEELGSGEYDFASWENFSVDISAFAGQTVRLLIAAADAGSGSLIEAGVDDVMIEGVQSNNPPIADPQSVALEEDTSLGITLSGSDFDGRLPDLRRRNEPNAWLVIRYSSQFDLFP